MLVVVVSHITSLQLVFKHTQPYKRVHNIKKQNFLKRGPSRSLLFSVLFKQTLQFLRQIKVKNVHPVHSAGNRTHNLQNTSLVP